jgi:hypothetical protein
MFYKVSSTRPARFARCVFFHFVPFFFYLTLTRLSQVYWTVYNSLLMGAQDALVAHYPSLELSDERNVYERDVRPFFPSLSSSTVC